VQVVRRDQSPGFTVKNFRTHLRAKPIQRFQGWRKEAASAPPPSRSSRQRIRMSRLIPTLTVMRRVVAVQTRGDHGEQPPETARRDAAHGGAQAGQVRSRRWNEACGTRGTCVFRARTPPLEILPGGDPGLERLPPDLLLPTPIGRRAFRARRPGEGIDPAPRAGCLPRVFMDSSGAGARRARAGLRWLGVALRVISRSSRPRP